MVSRRTIILTCVFPPVLSCTAVLESAVLAAKDRKDAPNILLTPKAMSSCYHKKQPWFSWHKYDSILNKMHSPIYFFILYLMFGFWISHLISINNIVMLDRIDFGHRVGHSKAHYSYREGIYCTILHHVHVWSKRRFISKDINGKT